MVQMKKNALVLFSLLAACGTAGQGNSGQAVVTILEDLVDDGDGEISLREAISFARSNDEIVTFKKGLTGTIRYAGGEIALGEKDDIRIAADEPIALDAKSASRHFSSTGASLSLDGLTLIGGLVEGGVQGGGSIYFTAGALKIKNCEFKDNDNQSGVGGGGAITVGEQGTLNVSASTFSSNKTATRGASIWSESSSLLKISNSTFSNHDNEGYGVVYHEGSGDFEMSGGEVSDNRTARGAIYIAKRFGKASVEGVTFDSNKAEYGAAIVFKYSGTETDGNKIDLSVRGSVFTKNVGRSTGALDASEFTNLVIDDSVFAENTVDAESRGAGGAIRSRGSLSVTEGTFTKNGVSSPNLSIPGTGGAIDVSGLATSRLEITDSTFTENSAGSGGAVYLSSGTMMKISGCDFSKNTAIVSGGALVADSKGAVITGGSFSENTVTDDVGAANGGGAIHATEDLIVNDVTIINNSAPVGGGIFIALSELTLQGSTNISGNTASRDSGLPAGGGVCNSTSDIIGSAAVTNNDPQNFCEPDRAK